MKNYCTIADKDYLLYALTLYESLQEIDEEFTLFFLCLDDYVYTFLLNQNLDNIVPISVYELEKKDSQLLELRSGLASPDAVAHGRNKNVDPSYIQFCWALASYFSWYLLVNKSISHISYVDSDLFFYQKTQPFFNEIDNKSVGIISHRIPYNAHAGEYNVGIVYFNNDEVGLKCVTWWKDMLLNPHNEYAKTHGTCGDQKYLELFIPLFGEDYVCVVDSIGHLAPWNVFYHDYENDKIIWKGNEQELLFFHFAHFSPDFAQGQFKAAYSSEWGRQNPSTLNETVYNLYVDYYHAMKSSRDKYGL